MTAELVGPLPTVAFHGGPRGADLRRFADLPKVAYDVPKNTLDPRFAACTDHHVACDCREAELAEQLGGHRAEWGALHRAARSALAGHQVEEPWGVPERDHWRVPLCLCSGCVIHRTHRALLDWRDIDHETGRVRPAEAPEVPF